MRSNASIAPVSTPFNRHRNGGDCLLIGARADGNPVATPAAQGQASEEAERPPSDRVAAHFQGDDE